MFHLVLPMNAILVEERSVDEIAEDCVTLLRKILKIPVECTGANGIRILTLRDHIVILDLKEGFRFTNFRQNGQPQILFAGEACSEQFFSTTPGAMKTGIGLAKIILESISNIQLKIVINIY